MARRAHSSHRTYRIEIMTVSSLYVCCLLGTWVGGEFNVRIYIATRAPVRIELARTERQRARGGLNYTSVTLSPKNVRAKEPCTGPTLYFPICRLFFRFLGAKNRIKNLS